MEVENFYGVAFRNFAQKIADLKSENAKLKVNVNEAREVAKHCFAIVKELPADLSDLDPYFLGIVGDNDHWLWD